MRADQFESLQQRSVELLDIVLIETDPKLWPGDGIAPKDMTKDDRGDRYWCKKNAAATLSIAVRIQGLLSVVEHRRREIPPVDPTEDNEDLDRELASAEAEASRIIDGFKKQR